MEETERFGMDFPSKPPFSLPSYLFFPFEVRFAERAFVVLYFPFQHLFAILVLFRHGEEADGEVVARRLYPGAAPPSDVERTDLSAFHIFKDVFVGHAAELGIGRNHVAESLHLRRLYLPVELCHVYRVEKETGRSSIPILFDKPFALLYSPIPPLCYP